MDPSIMIGLLGALILCVTLLFLQITRQLGRQFGIMVELLKAIASILVEVEEDEDEEPHDLPTPWGSLPEVSRGLPLSLGPLGEPDEKEEKPNPKPERWIV